MAMNFAKDDQDIVNSFKVSPCKMTCKWPVPALIFPIKMFYSGVPSVCQIENCTDRVKWTTDESEGKHLRGEHNMHGIPERECKFCSKTVACMRKHLDRMHLEKCRIAICRLCRKEGWEKWNLEKMKAHWTQEHKMLNNFTCLKCQIVVENKFDSALVHICQLD